MKNIIMIYPQFFDRIGKERKVGGVETYLFYLGKLLDKIGYKVSLYQSSDAQFCNDLGFMKVYGFKQSKLDVKELYNEAKKSVSDGLVIFGADIYSLKTSEKKVINIMHGVGWDIPSSIIMKTGRLYQALANIPLCGPFLSKQLLISRRLRDITNTKHKVLVDYNSVNFYRTQFPDSFTDNYKVIPNFVHLPEGYSPDLSRHEETTVRILFARRFQEIRGTKIMVDAMESILNSRNHVEVVFAGEGPERQYIESRLSQFPNFSVDSYSPESSIEFHERFHIAVVPSIGSEGTSLSLAEAMGAGCAVIATDVGGMTNMILNDYNGVLVRPNAKSLEKEILDLIDNKTRRYELAERGHLIAKNVFSLERWNGNPPIFNRS